MHFFFSSRRRHTRYWRDWSSDVCSSDLSSSSSALSANDSGTNGVRSTQPPFGCPSTAPPGESTTPSRVMNPVQTSWRGMVYLHGSGGAAPLGLGGVLAPSHCPDRRGPGVRGLGRKRHGPANPGSALQRGLRSE